MISERKITCRITGQSNGPKCTECNRQMDSIVVQDNNHYLDKKEGHYCYYCWSKEHMGGLECLG